MRTKMLAACLLAAISLAVISCNETGKDKETILLTGKWKVTAFNDSSVAGLRGNSFFPGFNADSTGALITFVSDSSMLFTSSKQTTADTGIYHVDAGKRFVFVRGLSEAKYDTFAIKELNDSLLWVAFDSVHIKLKKQP